MMDNDKLDALAAEYESLKDEERSLLARLDELQRRMHEITVEIIDVTRA